jgi:hypothetical protein
MQEETPGTVSHNEERGTNYNDCCSTEHARNVTNAIERKDSVDAASDNAATETADSHIRPDPLRPNNTCRTSGKVRNHKARNELNNLACSYLMERFRPPQTSASRVSN